MIELLVGVGCFLTLFGLLPSAGPLMQIAALGLFFGAAAYALVMSRVNPIRTSTSELVLLATGMMYVVVGLIQGEDAAATSMAFLGAVVLMCVIARAVTVERLLDVGAWAMLACVLACLVLTRDGISAALSLSVSKSGLARYMPFGMAANLTGYTFGGASILLMRRVIVSRKPLERWVMGGAAIVSVLFVLAASARSSLLALIVAGVLAVFFEFRLGRLLSMIWVRFALAGVVLGGLVFSEKLAAYLNQMLELDSSSRGLGSGGSGRTELWARGLSTIFQDPWVTLFGGGFRSSGSSQIGFSTESSYITILLDSGVIFGTAIILVFWYAPIKALSLSEPKARYASALVLLAAFMIFLVFESIFNRYLLAIGNPISLLSLLLLLTVSLRRRPVEGTP